MSFKLTKLKHPTKKITLTLSKPTNSNFLDLNSVRAVHARKQSDFVNKQRQESLKSNHQFEEFNKLCSNFMECDDLMITHGQYQQKFSIRKRYA